MRKKTTKRRKTAIGALRATHKKLIAALRQSHQKARKRQLMLQARARARLKKAQAEDLAILKRRQTLEAKKKREAEKRAKAKAREAERQKRAKKKAKRKPPKRKASGRSWSSRVHGVRGNVVDGRSKKRSAPVTVKDSSGTMRGTIVGSAGNLLRVQSQDGNRFWVDSKDVTPKSVVRAWKGTK